MDLDGAGGGEKLGGIVRGKTVVRLYCIEKNLCLIKKEIIITEVVSLRKDQIM